MLSDRNDSWNGNLFGFSVTLAYSTHERRTKTTANVLLVVENAQLIRNEWDGGNWWSNHKIKIHIFSLFYFIFCPNIKRQERNTVMV